MRIEHGALAALRFQFRAAALEVRACTAQIGLPASQLCPGRIDLGVAADALSSKALFVRYGLFQPLPRGGLNGQERLLTLAFERSTLNVRFGGGKPALGICDR